MPRPETTLFMLMSVDGKISTGDTDALDFDRDLKRMVGVKEGLRQYYDLEQKTDLVSFNTGRVMAKIGINDREDQPKKIPVSFVLVDSKPHLTDKGVRYLSNWLDRLYLVTTNQDHPAFALRTELTNVTVVLQEEPLNLMELFDQIGTRYGIKRMTIQSGGTMNAELVRIGLIDHLSLVVAPVLVGGTTTPSLIGGEAIHEVGMLSRLKAVKLVGCDKLDDSYLHLRYDVTNV